jgi:hypothetical protein
MTLALLATVNLILVLPTGSVAADEPPCASDPIQFWICKGDKAWQDGYLVGGERLGQLLDKEELLPTVQGERDAYRDLVDRYKAQRDEYKVLRDSLQELLDQSIQIHKDYRQQRENMEAELVIVEEKYLNEARRAAELEAKYEGAWSDWEVGLFTAGVSAVALLVGVGATALAYELK